MFNPRYTITESILTNLVKFEVVKSMVESISLVEEWEARLKHEALVKRIGILAKIAGVNLDGEVLAKIVLDDPERDEKVADIALRLGVVGKEREFQQVLNLINSYKYVNHVVFLINKFKDSNVSEKELKQINAINGEKIFKADVLGNYRTREAVADGFSFVPAVEVPYLLEDILIWAAGRKKVEVNHLLDYGVFLYELVRILPFEENGLISVLDYLRLVMSEGGYEMKKLWFLETELLKNEGEFWKAVKLSEESGGELTPFLEFYAKSLGDSGDRLKTRLVNLVGELPKFRTESGKIVALSERQIAIMEEITVKGEMTIKELRAVLPMISDDTILRDLKDLLAKKMIKKRGKTKGAVYVLGKIKSFK